LVVSNPAPASPASPKKVLPTQDINSKGKIHFIEQKKQETLVSELELKISSLERKISLVSLELQESQEQAATLESKMYEIEDSKKSLERLLKAETQEVSSKETEIEQAQSVLRKKQNQVQLLMEQNEELKSALVDISERYKEVVRETGFATSREKELLEDIQNKQENLEDLGVKMAESSKQHLCIRDESETVKAVNKNLERKVELFEKKELEWLEKEQLQTHELEEARYERDVALKREQTLLKEIDQLTKKCLEQPKMYQEKNEVIIQTLKSQFNVERRRFCEETGKLEELCASLQSQIDRAMREKRAAESELEKLLIHIPAETNRFEVVLEELNSKFRASERDKYDAMQKLETLQLRLNQNQNQFDTERNQANEKLEDTYRRLRRLESEIGDCKKSEIQLQEKITILEHDKKLSHEQLRNLDSQYKGELKLANSKYEMHINELSSKLENVSESHAAANRDLQKLLSSQKIMSEKWKEEAIHMRDHYEQIIKKMNIELQQYQRQIIELQEHNKNVAASRRELLDQVSIEKRQYSHIYEKCSQLEKQNSTLSRQVAALIAKEVEIVEERNRIGRELDRVCLEREQAKKEQLKRSLRPKISSIIQDLNEQSYPVQLKSVTVANVDKTTRR
jgi:chromosome segregation ATPase